MSSQVRIPGFILNRLRHLGLIRPMMHDFGKSGFATVSLKDLLDRLFPDEIAGSSLARYHERFASLNTELATRMSRLNSVFKWEGSVESSTSELLYCLVRRSKPQQVMETGVSRGVSTFFILNGLRDNGGRGKLHSFDILPNAGILLNDADRQGWDFVLAKEAHDTNTFAERIHEIGHIDIFFHDSLHTYDNQFREYGEAFSAMGKGGLIVSDDVNFTWAFIDFVRAHSLEPYFLVTRKNVVGIARV